MYKDLGAFLYDRIIRGDAEPALRLVELEWGALLHFLDLALRTYRWLEARAIVQAFERFWDVRGLPNEARFWFGRCRESVEKAEGSPLCRANRELPVRKLRFGTEAYLLWVFVTGSDANIAQQTDPAGAEQEYRRLLETLEAEPPSKRRDQDIDATKLNLRKIVNMRGCGTAAERSNEGDREISDDPSDKIQLAGEYAHRGILAQEYGNFAEAEDWYRKSLKIEQCLRNPVGEAKMYHNLGAVAQEQGKLEEAKQWYYKSIDIKTKIVDEPGVAHSLGALGVLLRLLANRERQRFNLERAGYLLKRARDQLLECLKVTEKLNDRHGLAIIYDNLGDFFREDLGDPQQAEEWYRKSLEVAKEITDRRGISMSYHHLGRIREARGNLTEAECLYRQSLQLDEVDGNQLGIARNYHHLGIVFHMRRNYTQAEEWYRKSLAITERLDYRQGNQLTQHQIERLRRDMDV